MSLGKKFFSALPRLLLAATFSFIVNSCVSGSGPGAAPGGPPSLGGAPSALTGPSITENNATGNTSQGNGKTNDETTDAGDAPAGGGEEYIASAYVSSGTQGSGRAVPGPFPDPNPHTSDCGSSYIELDLLHEKKVCLVSSDENGKHVKMTLKAYLTYKKCGAGPSGDTKLRIVDKKNHQFIDTNKIHPCEADNNLGCVKFTIIVSPHVLELHPPADMKLRAYILPDNFAPNQPNVMLSCGDAGDCTLSNEEYQLGITYFYPSNLSEIAADAPACSTDSDQDD